MSSFLREAEHPIFYAQALYAHWEAQGARVLNGSRPLAIDCSKARQMSLLRGLGLRTPETRVVHRFADLPLAAQGLRWPLLVKADIGGSGAGIARYDTPEALEEAARERTAPMGVNGVALVQEYVPRREAGSPAWRCWTAGCSTPCTWTIPATRSICAPPTPADPARQGVDPDDARRAAAEIAAAAVAIAGAGGSISSGWNI